MNRLSLFGGVIAVVLMIQGSSRAAEHVAVVQENKVNVRGQASLVGEVITQLQKGEKVTVLEEIVLEKPKPNEPARWARIRMPANTPVWIAAGFVDPQAKTVTATRLNLRAGPGENYSVVGRLERGESVKEIRKMDDWLEIETPAAAYAFVAADLLKKVPGGELGVAQPAAPAEKPPGTPGDASTVKTGAEPDSLKPAEPNAAPPAPAPEAAKIETPALTGTNPAVVVPAPLTIAPADSAAAASANPTSVPPAVSPVVNADAPVGTPEREAESVQKRIVRREGIVRPARSIQAPSWFELVSTDTRKVINYLYTDDPTVHLKDFKGQKIVVTGEEGIDPRWPNTPVIQVETLQYTP